MARMRVLRDFDFVPPEKPRSCVAYKKGYEGTVRRVALEQGIAQGAAEEITEAAGKEETKTDDWPPKTPPAPDHDRTRKPEPGG